MFLLCNLYASNYVSIKLNVKQSLRGRGFIPKCTVFVKNQTRKILFHDHKMKSYIFFACVTANTSVLTDNFNLIPCYYNDIVTDLSI